MKHTRIITIGREFCSGGAETGRKIAECFGIPYYDKEIIDRTADVLKISESVVSEHDEKPSGIWNVPGYQYTSPWYIEDPYLALPIGLKIAEAQFSEISKLAAQGSCVITGRCADYVLKNNPDVFSVFIRADESIRISRAIDHFGISEPDAKKLIRRTDKIRSRYYNSNTMWRWGDPSHYDIVIDAGKTGTDAAAAAIEKCIVEMDK